MDDSNGGAVNFSREVRARGNPDYFDEVEREYEIVSTLRIPYADPQRLSPIAKLPIKVLVLLQVGVRRILEITEAFVNSVNAGLFAPSFVTARAALETACLLYRITQDVMRIVKAHDLRLLREFDERIMRALLGSKSSDWAHPEQYEALNVLTIIDQLTKQIPKLRSMYDLLSEYAHPNYSGMMGVYQQVADEVSNFIDHPAPKHANLLNSAVGMTGFALVLTKDAVRLYQERLLPEFVRLSEEEIHTAGKWPEHIPYPRP